MQKRCRVVIYKRDTYRRTGRTKSGFEPHYTKEQCSRRATSGSRCWQHANQGWLLECDFAQEYMPERQAAASASALPRSS
jgi:hypothetical protein